MITDETMQEEYTADTATETIKEESPMTMEDFKDALDRSFHKLKEGDIVTGTVIGVSDTLVTVDLGTYAEGIIPAEEASNDPHFSIKSDIHVGDTVSATIIREDNGQGSILLSLKQAADVLAWDTLKNYMDNKIIKTVKIMTSVNAGVTTFLEGIRAFIPASQLSISYVEDLNAWIGKEVEVIVITADEENQKLVLSGKEVEKNKAEADRDSKISTLQKGVVTKGTVEKLMEFGAFVSIGNGLSGLVHISQMCERRIKKPSEVVKEGDEVSVKILDIKDGKISLSMKAVDEKDDVVDDAAAPFEFSTGGEAATGLGDLLKNLRL